MTDTPHQPSLHHSREGKTGGAARLRPKEPLRSADSSLRDHMATKEDLARLEIVTNENFSRVDKQIAVLRFTVFSFGPAILALLVKLTFFS